MEPRVRHFLRRRHTTTHSRGTRQFSLESVAQPPFSLLRPAIDAVSVALDGGKTSLNILPKKLAVELRVRRQPPPRLSCEPTTEW